MWCGASAKVPPTLYCDKKSALREVTKKPTMSVYACKDWPDQQEDKDRAREASMNDKQEQCMKQPGTTVNNGLVISFVGTNHPTKT